ncbi:Uncharacterized protein PECH_000115 [Penicillium ucsense]|uniref:CFEM domain-containing protein n=1 Tax=Penicillium ucsense TaxID=2839758 RepID=A0A8J8WH60_9EURO|nr:Uncharacterized protein PECM_005754 [Penicillium ucsense]KAF7739596.1 Uncharacterized protein PECH_000115 [Penicillium ucsense]
MKSVVWLSFFGAGAMAHPSGLWWGTDQCYPSPEKLDNACLPSQEAGFDWSELGNGDNWTFEGFNFNGFDASDVCGNSGGKCIQAKLSRDDNYDIRVEATDAPFSVSSLHMSTSRDTLVIMNYHMPSGSICRQYVQSTLDGVDVTNEQCGGAVAVDFTLPEDSKFGECDMAIHRMDFDCSSGPQGPSEMPQEETPVSSHQPPVSTEMSSTQWTSEPATSHWASNPVPPVSTESWTRPTPSSVETSMFFTHMDPTPSEPAHTQPSFTDPAHTELAYTESQEIRSTVKVVETTSIPSSSHDVHTTPVAASMTEEVSESSTSCTWTTVSGSSWTILSIPDTTEPATRPASTHSLPAMPTSVDPTTADVIESTTSCTSAWITYMTPVETWSTSTIWSTEEVTSTSCAPTVTNCPAHSTTIVTSTWAVSTTICPYTSMQTSSKLTTWVPETSESRQASSTDLPQMTTADVPPAASTSFVPAPCPDVVPKCLNTWLTIPKCDSNSDAACFCPSSEFTEKVTTCIHSWGQSKDQIQDALSYFAGICAPYVPSNPEIIDIIKPCPTGSWKEEPHQSFSEPAPVQTESSPVHATSSSTADRHMPTSVTDSSVHYTHHSSHGVTEPGHTHTAPSTVITSVPAHGVSPVTTAPMGHITSAPTSYKCPSTTMTWSSHTVTVPLVDFTTIHSGSHSSVALVPGTSGREQHHSTRTCTTTSSSSFSTTTSCTRTTTATHAQKPTATVPVSNAGASLSFSSLWAVSIFVAFMRL